MGYYLNHKGDMDYDGELAQCEHCQSWLPPKEIHEENCSECEHLVKCEICGNKYEHDQFTMGLIGICKNCFKTEFE